MYKRLCIELSKSFKAMATSDAMPRRPRRFHRVVPCLLLCAAWLVVHQLNFVQGVALHGTRAAQRQLAQRFSQKGQQAPGQRDEDGKAEARRLTSSIKKVHSAEKLIEVLDGAVDGPIFNFFHASAAYTQLERLNRRKCLQKTDWDSPVLFRLHTRVENMILKDQLDAQGAANILWTIARLSDRFSVPTQLLAALVNSVPTKVTDMNTFDLSNCLWAVAQLKDDVKKVLECVPAIVAEIPLKIKGMNAQDLSNNAEALVLLRDSVPEVEGFLAAGGNMDDILRSAAVRLNTLLSRISGKDLSFAVPVILWACAKAEVYDGELLGAVARHLGSRTKLSALPDFGVCALSWSYQVLDTDGDFEDFKALLMSETEKRGFSEADVQSCQRGRSGWNYR